MQRVVNNDKKHFPLFYNVKGLRVISFSKLEYKFKTWSLPINSWMYDFFENQQTGKKLLLVRKTLI